MIEILIHFNRLVHWLIDEHAILSKEQVDTNHVENANNECNDQTDGVYFVKNGDSGKNQDETTQKKTEDDQAGDHDFGENFALSHQIQIVALSDQMKKVDNERVEAGDEQHGREKPLTTLIARVDVIEEILTGIFEFAEYKGADRKENNGY